VRARQTRATGAFSSIVFSMRSVMRNLLVAHDLGQAEPKRNHFVALRRRAF
jgi:hypothetical protein